MICRCEPPKVARANSELIQGRCAGAASPSLRMGIFERAPLWIQPLIQMEIALEPATPGGGRHEGLVFTRNPSFCDQNMLLAMLRPCTN